MKFNENLVVRDKITLIQLKVGIVNWKINNSEWGDGEWKNG